MEIDYLVETESWRGERGGITDAAVNYSREQK